MEMPHFLTQNTTIDSKLSELGGANYLAAVEVPEKYLRMYSIFHMKPPQTRKDKPNFFHGNASFFKPEHYNRL